MIKARPFIKWVGGKGQLLSQFQNYYPNTLRKHKITKFAEPFLGGGALFFNVRDRFKKAFLSDINLDLVTSYNAVKKIPKENKSHLPF